MKSYAQAAMSLQRSYLSSPSLSSTGIESMKTRLEVITLHHSKYIDSFSPPLSFDSDIDTHLIYSFRLMNVLPWMSVELCDEIWTHWVHLREVRETHNFMFHGLATFTHSFPHPSFSFIYMYIFRLCCCNIGVHAYLTLSFSKGNPPPPKRIL